MVWNMNFCAPFIPNDQTINFHRIVQTSEVLFLLVVYLIVHTYYKFIKKPAQTNQTQRSKKVEQQSSNNNQEQSSNHSQIENSSQSEQPDHQKSISINIDKQSADENESYISFKSSDFKTTRAATLRDKKKKAETEAQIPVQVKQMNLQQLQNFFPIVIGHHLVAMGASIMYSPYAQQSIACLLYSILIFLLQFFNANRYTKTSYVFWGIMCFLNVFIMMSALLEVGQSNYDYMRYKCFSQEYVSLY